LDGIRRALMGSVSDAVVRHAHCPVLVVRAENGGGGYLEGLVSTARRPRREGTEKKRSFWELLFLYFLLGLLHTERARQDSNLRPSNS